MRKDASHASVVPSARSFRGSGEHTPGDPPFGRGCLPGRPSITCLLRLARITTPKPPMAKQTQGRPSGSQKSSKAPARNQKGMYTVLGLIAAAFAVFIVYQMNQPTGQEAAKIDASTPLPSAAGYTMGKADAPVKVIEFADFECPACAQFFTLTEPDVRTRLIETGQINGRLWMAAGFGVNVEVAPERPDRPTVCLADLPGGAGLTAARVLSALDVAFRVRLRSLLVEGFEPTRTAWLEQAAHLGQRVELTPISGRIEGVMTGLGADGALILRLADGSENHIRAGEISLLG